MDLWMHVLIMKSNRSTYYEWDGGGGQFSLKWLFQDIYFYNKLLFIGTYYMVIRTQIYGVFLGGGGL